MEGAHVKTLLFELSARQEPTPPRKSDVCEICGGPWANVWKHTDSGDLLCEHGVVIGFRPKE